MWKEIPGLQLTWSTPLSMTGSLLAVGGKDKDRKAVTAIHHYQPYTGVWVKVGDLPSPRYSCTCAMTTDRDMLVAGGRIDECGNKTERVDLAQFLHWFTIPKFEYTHSSAATEIFLVSILVSIHFIALIIEIPIGEIVSRLLQSVTVHLLGQRSNDQPNNTYHYVSIIMQHSTLHCHMTGHTNTMHDVFYTYVCKYHIMHDVCTFYITLPCDWTY